MDKTKEVLQQPVPPDVEYAVWVKKCFNDHDKWRVINTVCKFKLIETLKSQQPDSIEDVMRKVCQVLKLRDWKWGELAEAIGQYNCPKLKSFFKGT